METKLRKCHCCYYNTLPDYEFEICEVCGWQQDDIQEDDPNFEGGANKLSLNQYRAKWLKEHHREEPNDEQLGGTQ